MNCDQPLPEPRLQIGTSGYSYPDWKPGFYPPHLKSGDWLSFYAREFSTVEINSSFYRVPSLRSVTAMGNKVPPAFRFTFKLPRQLTHERQPQPNLGLVKELLAALTPLQAEGKLAALLAQFPPEFINTQQHRDYLQGLRAVVTTVPLVVEFRHASWARPTVTHWLRQAGIGLCCVDSPAVTLLQSPQKQFPKTQQARLRTLMPLQVLATTSVAYVRLHGRNAATWWDHEHAYERYDYSYSPAELAEWPPRLATLLPQSREVYVFFNNCYKSQAVDAARQLRQLLGLAAPPPEPPQPVQLDLLSRLL